MPAPASPEDKPVVGDEAIRANHLILCEGKDDLYFLNAIIKRHAIPDTQVLFTGYGDSGFVHKLKQLEALGFLDLVSSVLFVGDNDTDPDDKLKKLINQIRDAGTVPVPTKRLRVAAKKGQPHSAILMIPWYVHGPSMNGNRPGDLETLVWDVMKDEYPNVAKCVDEFVNCTPAKRWDVSPQSKMKLAALIAATCKKDPECPTIFMWQSNKKYQPLLDKPLFAPLVAYLKRLSTYIDKKRAEKLKLTLGAPI